VTIGCSAATPIITASRTTSSILSPLSTAWTSVSATDGSGGASTRDRICTRTSPVAPRATVAIRPRYSRPRPSNTVTLSPTPSRRTRERCSASSRGRATVSSPGSSDGAKKRCTTGDYPIIRLTFGQGTRKETMIGNVIGKYRIVGQLGRGAMGTVYRAVDETLYREVAIKVLNPDLLDTPIMKRFWSEATLLARLNHPLIATIYDLFTTEQDILIVMELVPGETLERICSRGGVMAPAHAVHIIDRVLSALDHAHLAGIVHCDIKPANVMVTAQGEV